MATIHLPSPPLPPPLSSRPRSHLTSGCFLQPGSPSPVLSPPSKTPGLSVVSQSPSSQALPLAMPQPGPLPTPARSKPDEHPSSLPLPVSHPPSPTPTHSSLGLYHALLLAPCCPSKPANPTRLSGRSLGKCLLRAGQVAAPTPSSQPLPSQHPAGLAEIPWLIFLGSDSSAGQVCASSSLCVPAPSTELGTREAPTETSCLSQWLSSHC